MWPGHAQLRTAALRFGALLLRLATHVFDVPSGAVKVFYHGSTPTIAFNHGGLLYFNLRHYLRQPSVTSWFMVGAFFRARMLCMCMCTCAHVRKCECVFVCAGVRVCGCAGVRAIPSDVRS